jgi:hypothetical protein
VVEAVQPTPHRLQAAAHLARDSRNPQPAPAFAPDMEPQL